MRTFHALFLTASFFLAGCSGFAAPETGNAYTARSAALAESPAAAAPESLFRADQAVMTNDEIGRIFAQRIVPPAQGRLAILRLGPSSRYLVPELAAMERANLDDVLAQFRASRRLSHAMVMPTMLTPHQMTIPLMREAAARLQADTLMIYRTASQSYQRSRAFSADETRAYCTVEGILLDTRSGIVTYTAVATEQFAGKRLAKDLSFEETMHRAEQEAAGRALSRVAAELVQYLDAAPSPPGAEQTTTTRASGQGSR